MAGGMLNGHARCFAGAIYGTLREYSEHGMTLTHIRWSPHRNEGQRLKAHAISREKHMYRL